MASAVQDAVDRALLEQLQAAFPLSPRPYAALGEALELDEAGVLARVRTLKEAGLIRHIGGIFDTRRLGYHSTLVAFHVPAADLEAVAAQISAHPGVSHNYGRAHHYNLWFTLAVPPGREIVDEIMRLAGHSGVDDWLNLPVIRFFKLKTHFRLKEADVSDATGGAGTTGSAGTTGGADATDNIYTAGQSGSRPQAFTAADIPFVRALQQDLALVPRPFAHAAGQLGLSEEALLARAGELLAAGILRRFGAVLHHRRVGYVANGMACWIVPEERIEEVGRQAAGFPAVSHCYQRLAHPPRWPYTLFAMIHGETADDVEATVTEISWETRIRECQILYSTREFKKERVQYFVE